MKVLLASTPVMGHLNPVLAIGHILRDDGHDVRCISANYLRDHIEAAGTKFYAFPGNADPDLQKIADVGAELKTLRPGAESLRCILERAFVEPLQDQYHGILRTLDEFPADLIIGDHLMLGVFPLLLGKRKHRPATAFLGTTYLIWRRDDGAPNDAGVPPVRNEADRAAAEALFASYEEGVFGPVRRRLNEALAKFGIDPLLMNLYDAAVELPDAYLQLSVPSLELPRRALPSSVHFVGSPPISPRQAPLPNWMHELDGSRRVVLVTQGTWTNDDFSQLTLPALEALSQERDVLTLVTTGGKPATTLPGPLPANARVAEYLPFEQILPKVDVLVTNGGFGTVNQALSFGVPLVTAGTMADRGDVNVRIDWSGVGKDLRTNTPAAPALRAAVRDVLDSPLYRQRAASIQREIVELDSRAVILRILKDSVKAKNAS